MGEEVKNTETILNFFLSRENNVPSKFNEKGKYKMKDQKRFC